MATESMIQQWQENWQTYWQLYQQQMQQISQMMQEGSPPANTPPHAPFANATEKPDNRTTLPKFLNNLAPNLNIFSLKIDPQKWQAIEQEYKDKINQIWQQVSSGHFSLTDRRFTADAWLDNSFASFVAAAYLANSKALQDLANALEGDKKTLQRVRFAIDQINAASSPSNMLAFNADALQKAIQTQGESLQQGLQNLLHDIAQGHISQTDESIFEVGKNVATTEGAVVFENELFQLIEYKPTSTKVYERPLLIVPPCINKFYILDLQPENSLVAYALNQGHRVFMLSWRNVDDSLAALTWDDYIEKAAITAIEVVQSICKVTQINTLGFCIGGTILISALSVLAARGQQSAASVTLLTTLLDFANTGILDIFVDEALVTYREQQLSNPAKPKILNGQELASTFSFLRPNELVWNYVVSNYLKGEKPVAFDLLYWNSDSTNLPGPMYTWYLRNTYLENNLKRPNALTLCGQKIDLKSIKSDFYIYGSREDHIVPIDSAYASTQVLSGKKRFVMGASGHIAGVINPASKNKRNYWVAQSFNDKVKQPATLQKWQEECVQCAGSWWNDWAPWLISHAGKQVSTPKEYGSKQYKVIEDAPGRYVKARA